MVTGSIGSD
jgi:hypothetical protein